jgi:hypothetical protein
MVAGSVASSFAQQQPPYDQDDYDQNSNLINVTHGIASFSSALEAPNPLQPRGNALLGAALIKL